MACLLGAPAVARAQGAGATQAAEHSIQPDLLVQALELEQQGRHAQAAAAYRRALATPHAVSAMLGLERVYVELGWGDSVLAVVDSVIRAQPRNPTYRTIQLRTLMMASREQPAREAFERWLRDAPRDVSPYREYARLLLQAGRPQQADTILQRAEVTLGSTRGLATETAQLRASMGLWEPATRSWREAVQEQDYLFQAAAFSLQLAPETERERIRRTLLLPPVEPGARRIAAALELAWGNGRDGWAALRELVPDEAGMAAWRDFAELAEGNEAWLAAADAFEALYRRKRDPELAARAARAWLAGDDPVAAHGLTKWAIDRTDDARVARLLLAPHVQALTRLGRAPEAEAAVRRFGTGLAEVQRASLQRAVAWGWVRAGDPARARQTLADAGLDDDEEITGWLALYDGDVAAARQRLRRAENAGGDQLLALAFLVRTKATRAPLAGKAFLALARGDSAVAARALADAAPETPDAAPLLLGAAARLHAGRGDVQAAIPLWETVLAKHADSPEAAEADLAWGRALRKRGDTAGATARFEHLILTWPRSALVPQARRELDLMRVGR